MRTRWFGWWYISIGAGFIALGLRALISGVAPWSVVLRFVVAAGFLLLGAATLKGPR